jgi:hypothetical protein
VHPALERLLGKHLRRTGVLQMLAATGTPQQLRALGAGGLQRVLAPRSPRLALTLPRHILTALDEQMVSVPATAQYGRVVAGVAEQLLAVLGQRAQVAADLEELLPATP